MRASVCPQCGGSVLPYDQTCAYCNAKLIIETKNKPQQKVLNSQDVQPFLKEFERIEKELQTGEFPINPLFYIKKQPQKTIVAWQALANQGVRMASWLMGHCYRNGHGVQKNHNSAAKMFNMGAYKHLPSIYAIAECYEHGWGTGTNYTETQRLMARLHDGHFNPASYYFATIFFSEDRWAKFDKETYHQPPYFLKIAAERGYQPAQRDLGRAYLIGRFESSDSITSPFPTPHFKYEVDFKEAEKWLVASTSSGSMSFYLSQCYEKLGKYAEAEEQYLLLTANGCDCTDEYNALHNSMGGRLRSLKKFFA